MDAFEPVHIDKAAPAVDTRFADEFVRAFSRLAKSQVKTQQAVAMSVEDVQRSLEGHADVLDDLRERRREAEAKNERLVRFVLEAVDLIDGLYRTTRSSDNADLRSAADTLSEALRPHMERISLAPIPALGEEPDSLYHFVLSSAPGKGPRDKGRIIEVVRTGYLLDGRVIRKADVIIGS